MTQAHTETFPLNGRRHTAWPGRFEPSQDTSDFEVAARIESNGQLTAECAQAVCERLDRHGFAIVPGVLSDSEARTGLGLIKQTVDDPERHMSQFASETDNQYKRRNFCALPSTPASIRFAASLCKRLEGVISEYCGHSRALLEITTLTSHKGSSHQYIHRDPDCVLSMMIVVDDITPEQGGTLFVPGTHKFGGANIRMDGRAFEFMELFRAACNARIMLHNFRMLWRMRHDEDCPLGPGEFRDRVFSRKQDDHQPNILRFLAGRTYQFHIRMLSPVRLWKTFKNRRRLDEAFRPVRTAPKKGTVILFRSDLMHAGGDNHSDRPRHLMSLSIARDVINPDQWALSYSPDPTLREHPYTFGDLLRTADAPTPLGSARSGTP
jgi:ectoine hydroxylase-related dioxygenase (phytanoyl-CoA dioxygenase family)